MRARQTQRSLSRGEGDHAAWCYAWVETFQLGGPTTTAPGPTTTVPAGGLTTAALARTGADLDALIMSGLLGLILGGVISLAERRRALEVRDGDGTR